MADEAAVEVAIEQGLDASNGDPGKQPSIREAWAATIQKHGPITYPDEQRQEIDETAEAAPVETEPEKPEPTEKKAAKPAEPEPEHEQEEPEEDDEGEKPTVSRKDFFVERRKLRERYERADRQQEQKWSAVERRITAEAQRVQTEAQKLEPLQRAARCVETGDWDGIAKALGETLGNSEIKDWNTLNTAVLQAIQSPVYKEVRDLRRAQEEQRRQDEQRQQQWQAHQAEQQKLAEQAEWKRGIAAELSSEEDEAIPALIESRPQLVDAIFNIQNAHYHETRGELLSPRDAAVKLLENVRDDFHFWSEFFEEHGESEAIKMLTGSQASPKNKPASSGRRKTENSEGTSGRQRTRTSERQTTATRPASKTVPQSQTAAASALSKMSDEQLKKFYAQKMEQDFSRLRGADFPR